MKRKKLAVSLVGVILVSCSASTSTGPSPSQEELEDARTHLQAVSVAMEAYWEAEKSLPEWRDPSGREAMAAIERMAQALKSVEATAADYRTALSASTLDLEVQALGLLIPQNAEATRAAWAQARPEFEAWLLRGRLVSRAKMLRSFHYSYNALESSVKHAEYTIDRFMCEGSGNDWNADSSSCD